MPMALIFEPVKLAYYKSKLHIVAPVELSTIRAPVYDLKIDILFGICDSILGFTDAALGLNKQSVYPIVSLPFYYIDFFVADILYADWLSCRGASKKNISEHASTVDEIALYKLYPDIVERCNVDVASIPANYFQHLFHSFLECAAFYVFSNLYFRICSRTGCPYSHDDVERIRIGARGPGFTCNFLSLSTKEAIYAFYTTSSTPKLFPQSYLEEHPEYFLEVSRLELPFFTRPTLRRYWNNL